MGASMGLRCASGATTGMHLIPVLLMATMGLRGSTEDSLSEPARGLEAATDIEATGIALGTMAGIVADTMAGRVTAADIVLDMAADMPFRMAGADTMAVVAEAITAAVVEADTMAAEVAVRTVVEADMAVVDTGNLYG
jgi:hypothetical protein